MDTSTKSFGKLLNDFSLGCLEISKETIRNYAIELLDLFDRKDSIVLIQKLLQDAGLSNEFYYDAELGQVVPTHEGVKF